MAETERLRAEAQARYERGEFQGALEAYLCLLELEAESADAHNDLATVYFRLRRFRDSMCHYVRALKLKPDHAEASQNFLTLCRATGISPEAAMKGAGGQPSEACASSPVDISVVVPVGGSNFEAFDACLDALYSQTFPAGRCEVLAVANGVNGGATQQLGGVVTGWQRHFGSRLKLLWIPEASIPIARNEGVAHSRGRIVMQINQDAALSRAALAQHYAGHEGFGLDPRCVIIGGRKFGAPYLRSLFNYLHESIPLYTPLHRPRPRFLGDHTWCVTCNMSALREAFDRFGLYDPLYAWGSDQELGRRWETGHGARIYVDTNIIGYHLHWLSFEWWKGRCIEAAPSWFLWHMGMMPEELPPQGRQAVRDKLDTDGVDMGAMENDLRRIERSFSGPESFAGETVLGVRVRTLAEFNGRLRRVLTDYRTHLQYVELWKRIEGNLRGTEAVANELPKAATVRRASA